MSKRKGFIKVFVNDIHQNETLEYYSVKSDTRKQWAFHLRSILHP